MGWDEMGWDWDEMRCTGDGTGMKKGRGRIKCGRVGR